MSKQQPRSRHSNKGKNLTDHFNTQEKSIRQIQHSFTINTEKNSTRKDFSQPDNRASTKKTVENVSLIGECKLFPAKTGTVRRVSAPALAL